MENQKTRFIPSPPKGPDTGSMPWEIEQKSTVIETGEVPEKPEMPDVDFSGFKMVGAMNEQIWEHHNKFHLDENGDFKPHILEKGLTLMEKFMG